MGQNPSYPRIQTAGHPMFSRVPQSSFKPKYLLLFTGYADIYRGRSRVWKEGGHLSENQLKTNKKKKKRSRQ